MHPWIICSHCQPANQLIDLYTLCRVTLAVLFALVKKEDIGDKNLRTYAVKQRGYCGVTRSQAGLSLSLLRKILPTQHTNV